MAMNKYLSIITLNVNGLNAPIKRHRIAAWIRKHGGLSEREWVGRAGEKVQRISSVNGR
jgi:hypothetical protein